VIKSAKSLRTIAPHAGWVALVGLAVFLRASASFALDESEMRGKQIYFEGTSPSGTEIMAVVGDEAAVLPASAMPCSSCHGSDGLGRPEGGVIPLDIRWSELVKTYGHVHHDGRQHPAFDDDGVARSIIAGVDQANNPLDRSMPIYQMSQQDVNDLVAYMKVLEFDLDPGIEDDVVRVATLLPLSGRAGETGDPMRRVLEGYFADVNELGGVFGRRIELLSIPLGESAEDSLQRVREAFATEGIFALVGAYSIGLDESLLTFTRSDNVPLVAPFTLDPGDAFLDSAAFYLYAGFDDQAKVLAERALADGAAPDKVLIVGPQGERSERLLKSARDQIRSKGDNGSPVIETYAPDGFDAGLISEKLQQTGAQAVMFVGAQTELDAVLSEFVRRGQTPRIYLLSSLVGRPMLDAPGVFDQRIFIAYPTLSRDITPQGRETYGGLAERYELPREHIQAQLVALAAAQLFVEGLRQAGRELSRERLVEGIEKLYQFQTGVTPPLTYGPNRRIGARGAHVMTINLQKQTYEPVGDGWFDVR
jgi:ABC-type branched-subunit amino acid transport system substrate-binding protein